jgi:2-polyprenyl-3-methyl-5-hydroxy-6-metoxy-1,4-benzoquinol methylase
MKKVIRQFVPPILWNLMNKVKNTTSGVVVQRFGQKPTAQDLNLYWDKEFAKVLDTWGEGTTWHEIVYLLASREGKVLDIACGTGKTMQLFDKFPQLEVHGCDISD